MLKRTRDKGQDYKYASIKTDLSIQILEGRLRPHDRIPSLNEITAKYKVSKITARRVLNDLVNEGLVYASRGRGSFVAEHSPQGARHTQNAHVSQIGVVFEHGGGSFMGDIIMGIDQEAFEHGTSINLCLSNNSYEREAENLQRLVDMGIDRILLFMVLALDDRTINPNIPLYLALRSRGVRLLLIACEIPSFPIPSIVYDDMDAFRRLVHHFKGEGYRRLAYVTRGDNASTTAERLRGFKEGLLESGLSYNADRLIRVRAASVDQMASASAQAFGQYLTAKGDADAVICSDEIVAAGVFDALEKAGRQPRDFPIVGGMGSSRNLHVLRGHPYVLLEDDTRRLGREAAAQVLAESDASWQSGSFRRIIPVPLKSPRGVPRRSRKA